VISLRQKRGFVLSQIGNADETPIWFDVPQSSTVKHVGKRSDQVRMTGADKQPCAMMFAVTTDYHK
jgi:hypothetical protein